MLQEKKIVSIDSNVLKQGNKKNIANLIIQKGIFKTMLILGAPIFFIFLCNSLYYMFDTFLIVHYVDGAQYIKGIIYTYVQFFTAFCFVYISGTSMYFNYQLGRKANSWTLAKTANAGIVTAFILGACLFVIIDFTLVPYLSMVKNLSPSPENISPELLHQAQQYIYFFTIGNLFLLLNNLYSRIARVEGFVNVSSLCMLVFYPLGLLLDWIFMGVLNLGMGGAGLAMMSASLFSFGLQILYLSSKSRKHLSVLSFKLTTFRFDLNIAKKILIFGLPATFWNICSILNLITQSLLLTTVSPVYQAFFTEYQLAQQFVLSLSLTLSTLVGTLAGFLIGHKMHNNLSHFMVLVTRGTWIVNGLSFLVLISCFSPISNSMNIQPTMELFWAWFIMVGSWSFFSSLMFMSSFLTASKNGKTTLINIFIQFIVLGIPMQLIFFFGIFVPTNNIFGYVSYMPVWAFLSSIYLTKKFKLKLHEVVKA